MKQNLTKDKKKLLILEPSVFINIKQDEAILYDSILGIKLVYSSKGIIDFLISNKHEFYHYFYLKQEETNNHEVNLLIDDIIKNNLGFIIFINDNEPVQFPNIIPNRSDNSASVLQYTLDYEQSIKSINEITISVDQEPAISEKSLMVSSFPLDFKYSNKLSERLFLDKLNSFLHPVLTLGNIFRINIIGDILNYPLLETFIIFIRKNDDKLIVNYIVDFEIIKSRITFIQQLLSKRATITIVLKSDFNSENLINLLNFFPQKTKQIELQCIIESEDDVKTFDEILSDISDCDLVYKPFFNGNNYSFFEKNVFLNEVDIKSLKPNAVDIIKWQQLNPLDFGKLIVLSNGDVYSNIYNPNIGNILNDTIGDIVEKELSEGKSWLKTRKEVHPCKSCIYELVCPPISNYEYALNKNNLCLLNDTK